MARASMQGEKGAARRLTVANILRTTVKVPFREVPARNMDREIPHWRWSEIVRVHLKSGHVGFGETLLYYTWGATRDADVKRAYGKNAAELMWDDSLGAGLQMALFDAVARALEVPVHALLGKKVHDRTPVGWWNIDTSPEDMASECKEAYRQGYRAYKTKGRPWFDVWRLMEVTTKAVPKDFHVALDFNDTLLDAKRGIPILKDLAKYPQMAIYETPIFQSDVPGNKAIRKATRVPVAMHYGNPPPVVAIREDVCDGFVVSGGASRLRDIGAVAAMANKPFWLQLVGTSITAAYSLHHGAVHSHATWPAVNCHQLFTHTLLTKPIVVKEGYARVPDTPGLGYELDPDQVAKFKMDKPKRRPEPRRLIETTWPDGRKLYIANNGKVNFMLTAGQKGEIPYFERGVTTRLVPDDGSAKWRELYAKARKGVVLTKG
jgi:L-alanine-DL-glutamate epimerase-like enolase superfamily enzyme